MTKDQLIYIIEKAFSGVLLDDGIGLWEAQAIDDYESEEVQSKSRAKDIKDNWTSISAEELQRCHSSLSFFDADGMRFHLPAFILASLIHGIEDPLFHLTHLTDYSKARFTSLNSDQFSAIQKYLSWCLSSSEYEFEHPMIEKALRNYWQNLI